MSDKIRKYVLPNLPYLFVFWFFSKIGTAYRIAPGTDFGTKLMGMLDTFPKAFETYWPGLGGIDLLVGLAGAAGMYLLIQSKIRQAKKFRRDAEYGTARFGTKEDIKPFIDPKFQNNVILTGTEFLTMNTRPKIPANARNLNACVIGSSGSGKTRFWLTPQLLQAHSSYVVVDPKGGTLDQCGRLLQREKYRVRVFNSIDFSKSMHYNPLAYIKTESDVLKFVTALIANTKGDGKEGDEFWTKAETLLYCALVSYIVFEGPEEERNMNTLVEMIYLVIDKQKTSENVYFLNTVTTDDLLPLAEQGKEPPKEVTPEPEPKPTEPVEEVPEPKPEKKDSPLLSLLLIGAVVLAGGGIGYYFKIYKPKHEAPDLEDDYCEYEDGELEEIAEEPEDEDTPPWEEDTEE